MKHFLLLLSFTLSLSLTTSVQAHHSLSMYTDERVTVEGTIEEVRAVNPHVAILIKTANEAAPYFLIETESRINLVDYQGVDLDVLQPGMRITATGLKGKRENTMFLHVGGITPGERPTASTTGRGGKLILEDGTVFFPPAVSEN